MSEPDHIEQLTGESLIAAIQELWGEKRDKFKKSIADSGDKLGFTITGKIDDTVDPAVLDVSLTFQVREKSTTRRTSDEGPLLPGMDPKEVTTHRPAQREDILPPDHGVDNGEEPEAKISKTAPKKKAKAKGKAKNVAGAKTPPDDANADKD